MKRLVIDDVRIMTFDCTYARTSKEAISVLESDWTWDEVWFDHDLGGDDTVIPVVSWLEEVIYYGHKPAFGKVVIHTSNPPGRALLDAVLSRHYPTYHVAGSDWTEGFIQWD